MQSAHTAQSFGGWAGLVFAALVFRSTPALRRRFGGCYRLDFARVARREKAIVVSSRHFGWIAAASLLGGCKNDRDHSAHIDGGGFAETTDAQVSGRPASPPADDLLSGRSASPPADSEIDPGAMMVGEPSAIGLPARAGSQREPAAPPARPLTSSLPLLAAGAPPAMVANVPRIVLGSPTVSGGILPAIDRPLGRLKAGILACYARSLDEHPPERSAISLRLAVSTNGSVRSVTAERVSALDPAVVECIVRRAEVATFPAPVGEPAEILLPMTLHPTTVRRSEPP